MGILRGMVYLSGLLLFTVTLTRSDMVNRIGFVEDSIVLLCPVASPGSLRVQWFDKVYNMGPDPELIFDSEDNDDFSIAESHRHKHNYMVDQDYQLTIKMLSTGDAGEYVCQSQVNATTTLTSNIYLLAVGKPTCSNDTTVSEGQEVSLQCSAPFSGNKIPQLQWYKNDEKMEIKDLFEINLAKVAVEIQSATVDLNQAKFTCKLHIGDIQQECHRILNVQYSPRNIKVSPMKDSYGAGEKITCSAEGNPAPKVTWKPDGSKVEQGEGRSTVTVDPSLEGTMATYVCTASNMVNSVTDILSKNISFQVTEPVTEPPKAASGTDSSNTAVIIGCVIGIIVVLVVIIAIVIICRKRNSSKKPKGAKPVPTSEPENGMKKTNDVKA